MNFQSDIKIVNIFDINLSSDNHYLKIAFPNLEETTDFHPFCGLSLKNAKSMRFRNNEHNQNRIDFFNELQIDVSKVLQPELIHSKEVYDCSILENDFIAVESFLETSKLEQKIVNVQGDGIITKNQECFPTITVADCVPIWFYEPKTKVYGVVHSGWKGTGIIENALTFAEQKYGAKIKDFRIIIGPHIHSCCYKVDEEREQYFNQNFAKDSCKNGMLSLEKANLYVLEKIGVEGKNVIVCNNCTNCDTRFGSFRRETGANIEKPFTVMSAFIGHF